MLGALRVWFQPVLPSVLSRRYNDKPYFLDRKARGQGPRLARDRARTSPSEVSRFKYFISIESLN